jgi:DNA-binding Lrp family transcriptional regulator
VDAIDEHILLLLQANGRLTNQELAAQVGLTPAPCLRRVRKLEEDGVITGYSAIVDRTRMGRGFEVIIHADLVAKDFRTVAAFEERMAGMSEVAELRRMFGIPDYFVRVRVADLAAFEKWLTTQLMGDPAIARVDSRITMKILKSDAP